MYDIKTKIDNVLYYSDRDCDDIKPSHGGEPIYLNQVGKLDYKQFMNSSKEERKKFYDLAKDI